MGVGVGRLSRHSSGRCCARPGTVQINSKRKLNTKVESVTKISDRSVDIVLPSHLLRRYRQSLHKTRRTSFLVRPKALANWNVSHTSSVGKLSARQVHGVSLCSPVGGRKQSARAS